MKSAIIVFLLFLSQLSYSQVYEGPYIDMVYHPQIRTLQFYPNFGNQNDAIRPPVIAKNSAQSLVVEFDVLGEEMPQLVAKIMRLNKNWLPAVEMETDYLEDYNEYNIELYTPSFNGKVPYVHYRFGLPRVKISGNYLLIVHDINNEDEVYFTKRFSCYDDFLTITKDISSFTGTPTGKYQNINFNVNYGETIIYTPREHIYTVIRKNGRFDQQRLNVPFTFHDAGARTLNYTLISEEYNFLAGNDYRNFDIRSVQTEGINVAHIIDTTDINTVILMKDEPRVSLSPQFNNDLNGQYIIDYYENGDGSTDGDYVYTYFTLEYPTKLNDDLYVFGAFSEWKLKDEFRMRYDEKTRTYYSRPLLKQGYYNYEYVLSRGKDLPDEAFIEGSYNQSENLYEVFIYLDIPGTQTDRLIGYAPLRLNPRN